MQYLRTNHKYFSWYFGCGEKFVYQTRLNAFQKHQITLLKIKKLIIIKSSYFRVYIPLINFLIKIIFFL